MERNFPSEVKIVEVGPRDGLQYESKVFSLSHKVGLVERLVRANPCTIELGSFVRPDVVPQMADTEELVHAVEDLEGVRFQGLVPNMKGLDRARSTGLGRIAVIVSASESHSRSNVNMSVEESLRESMAVVRHARELGLTARGYVSMAWGDPGHPDMPPARVAELATNLVDAGCDEVALGDTVGFAVPNRVIETVRAVKAVLPLDEISLHLHDTRGAALANVFAALEEGVTRFDAAVGGLGGCPFAPGASGNLASEDLVTMLHGMGIETGVDLEALLDAAAFIENARGAQVASRTLRALRGPYGQGCSLSA